MSDEDVTQDPHVIVCWSEAGAAAVGWSLQGMTGFETFRHKTWEKKRKTTYLNGVSGGWEGEFLSLDVEGHIGHYIKVTADDKLQEDGGREEVNVILLSVDVGKLMIGRCVFLALTSPSTPLAPTPRIIWRTFHLGPVINEVPVSTIAWQPPMQPTALPLMVIL